MYYEHLLNLIIQLKLLTFSLYTYSLLLRKMLQMSIACFTISLQNGGLLSSGNQSCFDGYDWFKVRLKE